MKTPVKKLVGLLFLGILLGTAAMAQLPEKFHYQAVIRDSQYQLLKDQQIAVKISILRDSEEGNADYVETHSVATNALGQIDLLIGDGSVVTGSMNSIEWGATTYYLKVEVDPNDGGNFHHQGTSQLVSVPYAMYAGNLDKPLEKLEVKEPVGGVGEEALFEVKREDGSVVFAVYNEGVRVFVDEEQAKGAKGGFAIGGYNSSKGYTDEYMRVTPDSVRIYVKDQVDKGIKGGFAVGGYNSAKGITYDLLQMSIDSVKMITNNKVDIIINDLGLPGKGAKGGFAVGGYNSAKNGVDSYLQLNQDNYFVGHQAGANNTTGLFNSFFGYQAGFSNTTGEYNLFQGYQSGFSNTVGNYNLFQGYSTGFSNTIGTNNIFMGFNSGYSNLDGEANVFIGNEAGYSNTTGDLNAFIGNQAGYSSRTGNYNTFLGFWSGFSNETGDLNTYLGAESGRQAISGSLNTVIGAYAGSEYDFGWHNTFIGMRAGSYNKGARNTIIGSQAGNANEEGDENIMIGFYSGESSIGSSNIYVGNNAGNESEGWNNIFIGNGTGFNIDRSNTLIIDNSFGADSSNALIYGETDLRNLVFNGNVGVWTYPEAAFHVGGDLKVDGYLINDKGLTFGSAFGPTPEFEATGNHLSFGDPGISEDFIGYKNNTFYFLDSPGGGDISDPDVIFGSNVVVDSGNVVIGWIFPTERLDVDGGARFRNVASVASGFNDLGIAPDGTLVRPVSDERLKTDFRELDNALEKILMMNAYSFEWKEDQMGSRDIGFKAQELNKVLPEAVFENPSDGYLGINYSRIPVVLVEAMKEQQRQIDEKDRRIEALEERLSQLEKVISNQ